MSLCPERTVRLGAFWWLEMTTALDRMSLEDAREALGHVQAALTEVDQFLNGPKVVQR